MKYLKKFENIGLMNASDKKNMEKLPREIDELISKLQKHKNTSAGHESIQNDVIIYLLSYLSDMDSDSLQKAKDALNKYLSSKSSGNSTSRRIDISHHPVAA
jgi:hypothetical protein